MRKIVAGFVASVDGYIEGPNGETDWILVDDKIDFAELMKPFDAFFYGRRSYEAALTVGATVKQGITHYVFSRTLKAVAPSFVLVGGDLKESVDAIRRQAGKDIAVFGGAGLLASLLNAKLVDEISISFIPVLLGGGKPMVEMLHQNIWLEFVSSKRYSNGTLVVRYRVAYQED